MNRGASALTGGVAPGPAVDWNDDEIGFTRHADGFVLLGCPGSVDPAV
jgi:hypothetical protein